MSYHTWSVNGYGICTNDIETTKDRVENLLSLAPNFNNIIQTYFKECDIENPSLDDYLEYDEDYCSGIAYLLQQVIEEKENVRLDIAEDFDCYYYLLLCPHYTWSNITMEEKKLDAIAKVDNLFKKYISILTDKNIDIDYQSVENGG